MIYRRHTNGQRGKAGDIGRLLRRLMSEYPEGPLSISDLHLKVGKPRSTIHRHLRGGVATEQTIAEYAQVLGTTPEDRERIEIELRRAAGYPTVDQGHRSDIEALVVELEQLDDNALDTVWQVVSTLRRVAQKSAAQNGSPSR